MKKSVLTAAFFLLCLSVLTNAQTVGANQENEAVKKVVESYLYAKEPEIRRQAFLAQAKIISLDSRGKVTETPVSKPYKKKAGETTGESSQKIVSIDVTAGGASVKVETKFPAEDARPAILPQKHIQYLSLLKVGGEWKIVQILMPPLEFAAR